MMTTFTANVSMATQAQIVAVRSVYRWHLPVTKNVNESTEYKAKVSPAYP